MHYAFSEQCNLQWVFLTCNKASPSVFWYKSSFHPECPISLSISFKMCTFGAAKLTKSVHGHYVTIAAKLRSLSRSCAMFSNVSNEPWAATWDDQVARGRPRGRCQLVGGVLNAASSIRLAGTSWERRATCPRSCSFLRLTKLVTFLPSRQMSVGPPLCWYEATTVPKCQLYLHSLDSSTTWHSSLPSQAWRLKSEECGLPDRGTFILSRS